MPKFASLVYYEDEKLTKKLDLLDLGRNVDLLEMRKLTFWMYNVGNTTLQKIKVVSNDKRLVVVDAPTELLPQKKASVMVTWTPEEEVDLKTTLEISGVYRGR